MIKRRRGWEIKESEATPETVFHDRRRVVQALAEGSILAGAGVLGEAGRAMAQLADPSAGMYPAKKNEKYTASGVALDSGISQPRLRLINMPVTPWDQLLLDDTQSRPGRLQSGCRPVIQEDT